VAAFLNGLILVAIGLVWRELRLTNGQRKTALVAAFLAAYVGLAANIFGALVDMPGPASQPGVAPVMPQAAIFFSMVAVVVPSAFIAFGLVLYGMRGDHDA
jgi:hypothetical protein